MTGESCPSGGRSWWAHFAFTRINIEPIILRKKFEDVRQLGAFMFPVAQVREPRDRRKLGAANCGRGLVRRRRPLLARPDNVLSTPKSKQTIARKTKAALSTVDDGTACGR